MDTLDGTATSTAHHVTVRMRGMTGAPRVVAHVVVHPPAAEPVSVTCRLVPDSPDEPIIEHLITTDDSPYTAYNVELEPSACDGSMCAWGYTLELELADGGSDSAGVRVDWSVYTEILLPSTNPPDGGLEIEEDGPTPR